MFIFGRFSCTFAATETLFVLHCTQCSITQWLKKAKKVSFEQHWFKCRNNDGRKDSILECLQKWTQRCCLKRWDFFKPLWSLPLLLWRHTQVLKKPKKSRSWWRGSKNACKGCKGSYYYRFRSDHLTKTIPLSEVNETKVAMLDSSGIEAETEAFYKNLFLIQDLYGSGYRMADVGPDENGLVNI